MLQAPSNGDGSDDLERLLEARNRALVEHAYFRRCRSATLSRREVLEVVKQLYCFSVFFERMLARRIAQYPGVGDECITGIVRRRMLLGAGHAQVLRDWLVAHGEVASDIDALVPRMFTKAMFGYLNVTVHDESEYVANVANVQVMERIGHDFFATAFEAMKAHESFGDAQLTPVPELARNLDPLTIAACRRAIDHLYRFIELVLGDWLPRVAAL